MTSCYDLVVLGAGPAGENAAELAAFFGDSGGVVTATEGGAYENVA